MKRILLIGGSDPSGGAGIQADIRTVERLGAVGYTVLTSVIAQNSRAIRAQEPVDGRLVAEQIAAVCEEGTIHAVKTGVLPTPEVVGAVASAIANRGLGNIVIDPVIWASDGTRLVTEEAARLSAEKLFPHGKLVTPNVREAEFYGGVEVLTSADMEAAARVIKGFGPEWVMVTGGDLKDMNMNDTNTNDMHAMNRLNETHDTDGPSDPRDRNVVLTLLLGPAGAKLLRSPRVEKPVRGTGCMLASAIAVRLAAGDSVEQAVDEGTAFVAECIAGSIKIGRGRYQVVGRGFPDEDRNH